MNAFFKTGIAKKPLALFLWAFLCFPVFPETSFTQGEAFFVQNRPREAVEFLEAAVAEDPAHVQASLYLGIAYQQLDRIPDAIAVYQKILARGGTETPRIAFNLGNAYFVEGSPSQAVQSYTQALEADPGYSPALLNRANAKIKLGSLDEAAADYGQFLSMEPQSPQRGQIERLITFIQEETVARERRRQEEIAAAEQRKRDEVAAEEQRRIAAEEVARQEAERRQRILEEISASLQAAAEETRSLSAGNEEIESYEGEFELE